MADPNKPVDWYLMTGILFIMISGAFTLIGDRVCFLQDPVNDLQRIIGLPTLLAYHLTEDRAVSAMTAFIFWGILFGVTSFTFMTFLIKKVLLPNQIRSMVKAERQQEFLKNKYRNAIPPIDMEE